MILILLPAKIRRLDSSSSGHRVGGLFFYFFILLFYSIKNIYFAYIWVACVPLIFHSESLSARSFSTIIDSAYTVYMKALRNFRQFSVAATWRRRLPWNNLHSPPPQRARGGIGNRKYPPNGLTVRSVRRLYLGGGGVYLYKVEVFGGICANKWLSWRRR